MEKRVDSQKMVVKEKMEEPTPRNILETSKNNRDYRYIELQNGLGVLLVHDSKGAETQAAAALTVEVGYSVDPEECQGLAHLLEHVIFCGSEPFPGVDEFETFVKDHGGDTNATTGCNRTLFYFEVNHNYFEQALERFAACIMSPLLREVDIIHEISAVDAEFWLNSQDDSFRLNQLRRHTSSSDHRINRFADGNKDSLDGASRDVVMRFHDQYYRGDLMKLVLMGGESLDILQLWARRFGEIERRDVRPGPHRASDVRHFPIWPGSIYRIQTTSLKYRSLSLTWAFPVSKHKDQYKIHDYISYLIESEDEGGLVDSLKAAGWAFGVDVSPSNDETCGIPMTSLFRIDIRLTYYGLGKIFDIISMVYSFLSFLRSQGPKYSVLEELEAAAKLIFFLDKPKFNMEEAEELVEELRLYPPGYILYGDLSYANLDGINDFLLYLTPLYMRVDVISPFGAKRKRKSLVQKEPWFGTLYIEEKVCASLSNSWAVASSMDLSFTLPSMNVFITRSDELSKFISDEEANMKISSLPKDKSDVQARAQLEITLRDSSGSARNALLAQIFMHLLEGVLDGIIRKARVAGLHVFFSAAKDKGLLLIRCLPNKLYAVLTSMVQALLSINPTKDRFLVGVEYVKEVLKENFNPRVYSDDLVMQLLSKNFRHVECKLEILQDEGLYKSFLQFIHHLPSQVYVDTYFSGVPREDVVKIREFLDGTIKRPPIQDKDTHKKSLLLLRPQRIHFIMHRRVKNQMEPNSAVTLYFQIGVNTIKEYAKAVLFQKLVEQAFFHEMRTVQQLCYTACSGIWLECGVLGYKFKVLSPRFNPPYVLDKIERFLESVEVILRDRSHLLSSFKSELEDMLLDPSLSSWAESEPASVERVVSTLTLDHVVDWYRKFIRQEKCKIAFCVWGCRSGKIVKDFRSTHVIHSIEDFQKGRNFYTL